MHVPPPSTRYTLDDSAEKLKITIPGGTQWSRILHIFASLIVWFFVEMFSVSGLMYSDDAEGPGLILLIWITIWTIAGLWTMYFLFMLLLGDEIIEINSETLTIGHLISGVGFSSKYKAEDIGELRTLGQNNWEGLEWTFQPRLGGHNGLIAFSCEDRTIRIGDGLDEAEAKQVLESIRQRFPKYLNRRL